MSSSGAYEHLATRIESVVDELDDLQFEALRKAVAAKAGRPADDKRLTQVRRALEKAVHLLRAERPDDR